MAQLIGLDKDPEDEYPVFESEMRRRLWWHVCGLESRGAEEGGARKVSIMDEANVQLPSNLNDIDLDPTRTERIEPRQGVTEMTHVLVRFEFMKLIFQMMSTRRKFVPDIMRTNVETMKAEQRKIFESEKARMKSEYLSHLHPSRPMDWLSICWVEGMFVSYTESHGLYAYH
jgi:hypothetical protein